MSPQKMLPLPFGQSTSPPYVPAVANGGQLSAFHQHAVSAFHPCPTASGHPHAAALLGSSAVAAPVAHSSSLQHLQQVHPLPNSSLMPPGGGMGAAAAAAVAAMFTPMSLSPYLNNPVATAAAAAAATIPHPFNALPVQQQQQQQQHQHHQQQQQQQHTQLSLQQQQNQQQQSPQHPQSLAAGCAASLLSQTPPIGGGGLMSPPLLGSPPSVLNRSGHSNLAVALDMNVRSALHPAVNALHTGAVNGLSISTMVKKVNILHSII